MLIYLQRLALHKRYFTVGCHMGQILHVLNAIFCKLMFSSCIIFYIHVKSIAERDYNKGKSVTVLFLHNDLNEISVVRTQ